MCKSSDHHAAGDGLEDQLDFESCAAAHCRFIRKQRKPSVWRLFHSTKFMESIGCNPMKCHTKRRNCLKKTLSTSFNAWRVAMSAFEELGICPEIIQAVEEVGHLSAKSRVRCRMTGFFQLQCSKRQVV